MTITETATDDIVANAERKVANSVALLNEHGPERWFDRVPDDFDVASPFDCILHHVYAAEQDSGYGFSHGLFALSDLSGVDIESLHKDYSFFACDTPREESEENIAWRAMLEALRES